jgi:shikimate dehydrogenase
MTTGGTHLCCLIGDPVAHSLSPRMFSAIFSKLNMDYAYLAFRVRRADLGKALEGLRAIGFVGCNVTMPHKIEVMKYLDSWDEMTRLIGSVNVVANRGGKLVGYNTDGAGALATLDIEGVDVDNQRVLVVGYGGAARAVAFELAMKKKPAELLIAGRDQAKAVGLAEALEKTICTKAMALDQVEAVETDVIINATPVGMYPRVEESPLPERVLRKGVAVLDLVYSPVETKLLRLAREKGCKVINGLEMLVQQGAMTFTIWTGLAAPIEEMREAAREVLT